MTGLSPSEKRLLKSLSAALFGGKTTAVASDLPAAVAQTVPLLAFEDYVPTRPKDEDAVSKMVFTSVFRNERVRREHIRLGGILDGGGVPYVILKGCASAVYYPDPFQRMLGDVDFLVRKEDEEKTVRLLSEAGLHDLKKDNGVHKVFASSGARFELHTEPPGIPDGKTGTLLRQYFADIFEKAEKYTDDYGSFCVPSAFHHGLILLLHTAHHLVGEGIGLRQLCDFAVFYPSLSEEEFTALFEEKLKKAGLWTFCRTLTALCEKALGTPHRTFSEGVDESLTDGLLRDILDGGNLGQNDPSRARQRALMSGDGNAGISGKSKLSRFIGTTKNTVYSRHKLAEKHKILLIPLSVFYIVRYALRVLTGKRAKLDLKKTLSEADRRTALFGRLELFKK